MNKSNHTELPWILLPPSSGVDANWHITDKGDTFVAHVFGFNHAVDEQSKANAALIVHRVNNWDKLVEALEFYANKCCWEKHSPDDLPQPYMTVNGEADPNISRIVLSPYGQQDKGKKAKQALKLAKEGI